MKKRIGIKALLLPLLISSFLLAQAQRGDRDGRRTNGEEKNKRVPERVSNPSRNFGNGSDNNRRDNSTYRQPNPQIQRNDRITTPQRINNNVPGINRTQPPLQRNNGNRYGNSYGNSYSNNYGRNNYGGSRYYGPQRVHLTYRRPSIAPRFTIGVPYYGQRFTRLSYPYINIGFGGINYNYYGGVFYKPNRGYYQVVRPPRGIHISILPVGYHRFLWGGNPYYYYNGIFYNQNLNNNSSAYEVVDPPLGAKLPDLPAGAERVTIYGEPYFESDGTYYAEEYNEKNEVLYTVVGVHGVLNNDQLAKLPQYQDEGSVTDTDSTTNTIVKVLPPDCRKVEINGQQLYLSPQNDYYQEIKAVDGTVSYQVVGKTM